MGRMIRRLAVAFPILLALGACRPKARPGPTDAGVPIVTQGLIGVDGGTVATHSGVTLSFLPQSVDSDTTIQVTESVQTAPAPNAVSKLYQFAPDGLVFAHPVFIRVPVPAGTTQASLFWSHAQSDGGAFDELVGTVDGGFLYAQIVHFSEGYAGAPSGTRTVTGSVVATYQSQSYARIINQPQDFTQQPVNAFVWRDGGYVQYPGTGLSDGTFTVPNVPPGEFLLQAGQMVNNTTVMGGNLYFVTSSNAVDMGFAINGRPDARVAASPAYLSFAITNMLPWNASDTLELWGSDVDFWVYGLDQLDLYGNAPAAGNTALNVTINAAQVAFSPGPWLIQGSHNPPDILTLAQLAPAVSDAGLSYVSVQALATLPTFDEQSGTTVNVPSSLAPASATGYASFDVRQTQFAAWVQDDAGNPTVAPPGSTSNGAGLSISGIAGGLADGVFAGYAADFASASLPAGGPDFATGAMSYGVPAGENWGVFGVFSMDSTYTYQLPCTVNVTSCPTGSAPGSPLYVYGIGTYRDVQQMQAGPVVPMLSPPVSPLVNGQSLLADRSGVGLTPTFSWSPPAVGTPDIYKLIIDNLYLALNAQGKYVTRHVAVATLETPHTSITLPPGILQAGKTYWVRILAQDSGYPYPEQAPFRRGTPFHYGGVASGALTP